MRSLFFWFDLLHKRHCQPSQNRKVLTYRVKKKISARTHSRKKTERFRNFLFVSGRQFFVVPPMAWVYGPVSTVADVPVAQRRRNPKTERGDYAKPDTPQKRTRHTHFTCCQYQKELGHFFFAVSNRFNKEIRSIIFNLFHFILKRARCCLIPLAT